MANFLDISDSEDELDNEVCIGGYRGDIVGIRYYRGTVNNNEMVSLRREPHNPYDRNAVRVDNVYGIQVGHIKRELAKALADVMDNRLARLEGVVPFGKNNIYTMPCDITFWGRPENEQEVIQRMRRHGYILRLFREPIPSKSGASTPGNSGAVMSIGRPPSIKISQDQMTRELDKLFEKLGEQSKVATVEPAEAIKTKLFPHQKRALAWLIARENSTELPPFWKEKKTARETLYFNTATNYATSTRPSCVLGGILADDMGLGKTLEIIALIVTNFYDGKPLVTLADRKPELAISSKRKVKRTKHTNQRKSKTRRGKETSFLVDDDEIGEIIEDDEEDEDDIDDADDEDDAYSGDVSFNMTGKEDPDFSPGIDSIKKAAASQPVRRSSRTSKRTVRYVEADILSEEDSDVEEVNNMASKIATPTPNKRPKVLKNEKTAKAEDTKEPAVEEADLQENSKSKSAKKETKKKTNKKKKGRKGKQVPSTTTVDLSEEEPAKPPLPSLPQDVTAKEIPTATGSAVVKECSSAPQVPAITMSPMKNMEKIVPPGPRPTLVICPLSVLSNWQDQFETHVHEGLLNVYTYYGSERTKDTKLLAEQDVVLTTYQTLSSEFSKGKSPLVNTVWLRVVLDEGHVIRNPNAMMSKAVHELKSDRRWVVTGTPIQNSMKDLFSVISFLKLEPFTDRQWWRRTMERPISEGDETALGRLQLLMRSIAMRRTKTQQVDGKPLVELPDRQVFIQPVELSLEERQLYDSMAKEGKLVIGKYFKTGTVLNNYADVLAILMRLRQLCCHPKLCASAQALASTESCSTPEELRQKLVSTLVTLLSSGADEECPVCLDSLSTPVITHCAHVFCRRCIEDVIKTSERNPRCPLCRGCIGLDVLVEVPPDAEDMDQTDASEEWHSSSKVDTLMSLLTKLRSEDPSVKSLVISQFTSMLNVLETPLEAQGFNFVRLDGKMSQKHRAEVIESFDDRSADSPTVMLLSMKAGGVGLNLTAASRVFLLDPAWNPAAEDQCFDRCHRLGQTKDVIITKFVVKDSVEERMLELQKTKRELMAGAFKTKSTAEERRQQRIQDVKTLMDF